MNLGNIEIDGSNVTVSSANLQVANVTFAAASDKPEGTDRKPVGFG